MLEACEPSPTSQNSFPEAAHFRLHHLDRVFIRSPGSTLRYIFESSFYILARTALLIPSKDQTSLARQTQPSEVRGSQLLVRVAQSPAGRRAGGDA